jgi:putative transposase
VIYEFIRAEKAFFPVSVLCQVLHVSRSGFYSWHGGNRSKRELSDRRLVVEIKSVFATRRRTYGSPRVHDELRKKGWRCSLASVER